MMTNISTLLLLVAATARAVHAAPVEAAELFETAAPAEVANPAEIAALDGLAPSAACPGPFINPLALRIITESEGFRDSPYNDPVGKPTIGFGHLCRIPDCSDVLKAYGNPLTRAAAEKLLRIDLQIPQNCIAAQVSPSVKLNANQYGALVSWAYNVGCGNTGSSALIKRLNDKENPNLVASEELPKWRLGGGKVLPGLVTRRKREADLFVTPTPIVALPVKC